MDEITVELVGGPADGRLIAIDPSLLPDDLPASIVVGWRILLESGHPPGGRYVKTRKLSRVTGHLIYEYRNPWET